MLSWVCFAEMYFGNFKDLILLLSVLGIVEGVIGPTLLDLKDFIGVSLGSISFIIMVSSIGSMVGCFLSCYVMDKLVKLQYLMLAGDGNSEDKTLAGLNLNSEFRSRIVKNSLTDFRICDNLCRTFLPLPLLP